MKQKYHADAIVLSIKQELKGTRSMSQAKLDVNCCFDARRSSESTSRYPDTQSPEVGGGQSSKDDTKSVETQRQRTHMYIRI